MDRVYGQLPLQARVLNAFAHLEVSAASRGVSLQRRFFAFAVRAGAVRINTRLSEWAGSTQLPLIVSQYAFQIGEAHTVSVSQQTLNFFDDMGFVAVQMG